MGSACLFLVLCLVNTVSNCCHQPFWSDGTTRHSSGDGAETPLPDCSWTNWALGPPDSLFEDVDQTGVLPTKFSAQSAPPDQFCKWAKALVVITTWSLQVWTWLPSFMCCLLQAPLSFSVIVTNPVVSPCRFPGRPCEIIIGSSHKLITMPKVLWLSSSVLFSPWRLRGSLSTWCCAGLEEWHV